VTHDGLRGQLTLRHLLTHSSGLPAWRPLYREAGSRAEAFQLAETTPFDTLPGARYTYSDLGAIWMTDRVERAYGTRLDSLLERRVFGPLGLTETRFLPPARWALRIAPTENDPWRGRVLRGEVHDENAARLDGVSGHAGLFSSARDLVRFGEWLLAGGEPVALRPGLLAEFTTVQHLPPGSSLALGWDTPSEGSSAGTLAAKLWAYRLYRHLDMDRSRAPAGDRPAEQPSASLPRQFPLGSGPRGRRGQSSAGAQVKWSYSLTGNHL